MTFSKEINPEDFADFDFGFELVDSPEPELKKKNQEIEEQYKDRIKEIEGFILPFLVNLSKNPEKEYLRWPNRADSVKKIIDKFLTFTRSEIDGD
jgi:hypothetical protein